MEPDCGSGENDDQKGEHKSRDNDTIARVTHTWVTNIWDENKIYSILYTSLTTYTWRKLDVKNSNYEESKVCHI